MKKLYTTTVALALAASAAFAQSAMMDVPRGHVPHNPNRSVPPTTQSINYYTDYDYMDEHYQVDTMGYSYTRYIWDMNMRYDYTQGDTSLRWAAVDFSPLYDSYGSQSVITSSQYSSITIDSIFILAGHENNSGMNDTFLVHIVQCTSQGYPTYPGTILHTDTIITNQGLSTGNDWLTSTVIYTTPNFTINNNTTKFAVRVEYYGARQDTFGVLAGFGDLGPGNCAAIPQLANFAFPSHYAPNSYRHDMRFALPPYNIMQLPTSTGADTYYDCNGNATFDANTDSKNFLQNWGIWINYDISTGIAEQNDNIGVYQNEPNPFTGETVIQYDLKNSSNVSLTIFDVTGKMISTQQESNVSAGHHRFTVSSASLAPGVYYYTVQAGTGKVTRKMIVTE